MSDKDLLRFGRVARYMTTPKQLWEIRREMSGFLLKTEF
jgi:hypothetical protein